MDACTGGRMIRIAAIWLGVTVAATPALAQNDRSAFIGAGVFGSFEKLVHSSSFADPAESDDLSGTTAGGSVTMGAFLSPRWSAALELAFTGSTSRTRTISSSSIVTQTFRAEQSLQTGSVMVGYHPPATGRLTFGLLGGLAFVREGQTAT